MDPPIVSQVNRLRRLAILAGAGLVLATAVGLVIVVLVRGPGPTRTVLQMLSSDKSEHRKIGAWLAADTGCVAGLDFIARAVELGLERVPDVKEAYVYALGRSGRREHFGIVASVATGDSSGYVRQAAWLAAARIDPDRFRELAAKIDDSADLWDRMGVSIGLLEIGDCSRLAYLFEAALDGSADHKLIACNALYRNVGPLLEAVGRWPIGARAYRGRTWPPEFLDEVRKRCAELDLQALAEDTRPQMAAAKRLQRDARRLASARNWVARLLSAL
jgi:hypothetical protein